MSQLVQNRRLLLLLILLLAAFLRFWRLEATPPGLYHDEAYNGLDALSLLQGKTFPQFYEGWELYALEAHGDNPPQETRFPLFFEGNYGREPLHIYLMALSIKLFGPTPFAIRAVPALAGVLAVLTTYFAAAAILHHSPFPISHSPALIAAFALAVMFPAVHFSRFGLRVMLFLPVEALAVAFFWRGVAAGKQPERLVGRWFVAAGVMLGLGLYVYAAGRLFPLLFALFIPLWFWLDGEAARRFWRPVAVMAGAALVTAVPLLLFYARYPYFFFFRIAYVANKGKGTVAGKPWLTWLLNVGRVSGGLFWRGETHLRHNLPGRPYLDPVQASLFGAGLAWLTRRRFNPRAMFLGLWLAVMLLPSILSGDAPHFGRLAGAAPVIAILIGLGAARVLAYAAGRLAPALAEALALLLLLSSAALTARDYFGRYAQEPNLARDFYLADWRLGQYAAAQPPGDFLYLTPTQEEMATIYFALAGETARLRSFATPGSAWPLGGASGEWVYLVRPSAADRLTGLPQILPGVAAEPERDNFIPIHVPAAARPRPEAMADADYGGQIRLRGWSARREGDALHVTLFWQAAQTPDLDYTAFVHLLDAAGNLVSQKDRPPDGYPTSDWRPGEWVMDTYAVPLQPDLPPGEYRLRTGFYYLPTLEPLGTAIMLGSVAP